MSLADMTSARSSPAPDTCPDCDTSTSVTSDLHKYQVACTCNSPSAQYACAEEPGPPAPAKSGDVPPALPPRPAAALSATNRRNNAALPNAAEGAATCARRRKYAWWCVGCGALAAALGGLLAAAHILLRAYTASPHHLETVPAAVPAAMLVLTGVCIMSLARRRNRYSYMIKVVGACCLVCALTCVLVTITTTVIHMNKLQTLKFCEYTKLTRTCTCFSLPPDHHHGPDEEEGVRCVFEGVTDCGVVHGVLYWCLRGVFALSVTAVLVCIFSSMLAYQLLSHERKKMYWEQLELRCRSLYRPPAGAAVPRARPVQAQCACCQQCRQPQPAWDISLQHRFWAPGRIGNLYSPNPGTVRKASAWSWFPWPRTNSQRCRMGAAPQSGDSAYGFCDATGEPVEPEPPRPYGERPYPYQQQFGTVPRGALQPAGAFSRSTADFAAAGYREGCGEASGSFELQDGVWGPPPPYSPQGRGGSRHHLHQDPAATTLLHHHQVDLHRNSAPLHEQVAVAHTCSTGRGAACAGHAAAMGPQLAGMGPCQEMGRYQRESELAEAGRCNTLRGQLVPYGGCRRALGASAGELRGGCGGAPAECAHQVQDPDSECSKQGKENLAFQNDKHSPVRSSLQLDCRNQHTESEVYFADVSSCCNISLKADCCVNPNVSALVGTIENHPESTSGESDNGSFTLTRQQRPQPQTLGSKRRPRLPPSNEKSRIGDSARNDGRITDLNNSMRNSDGRIVDLNNSTRNNDGRIVDHNNSMRNCDGRIIDHNNSLRNSDGRIFDFNNSMRNCDGRIVDLNNSMRNSNGRIVDLNNSMRNIDGRMVDLNNSIMNSDGRIVDLNSSMRNCDGRIVDLNNSMRNIDGRMVDLNNSIRNSDGRIVDLNSSMRNCDGRIVDINNSMRNCDGRMVELNSLRNSDGRTHDLNSSMRNLDGRFADLNDTTRNHEASMAELNNSARNHNARIEELNHTARCHSQDMNQALREQFNRQEQLNNSIREQLNCSVRNSEHHSPIRMCENSLSDINSSVRLEQHSPIHAVRDNLNSSIQEQRRLSDQLNSSGRTEKSIEHSILDESRMSRGSPKIRNQNHPGLRKVQNHRSSPKESPLHPRQSSSDSNASHKNNPEFFLPPPPTLSPLSPGTEESLVSDEELERSAEVFQTESETLALGPDSQYEPVREVRNIQNEEFKPNHHHCYSDTNTMDSGWQSGSEKHVTD